MKNVFFMLMLGVLLARPMLAQDSDSVRAVQEISHAVTNLVNADEYSWSQMTKAPGAQFRPSFITGKKEKNGSTILWQGVGTNTPVKAVITDGEISFDNDDAHWNRFTAPAFATAGTGNNAFLADAIRDFKTPAMQVMDFVSQLKHVQSDAGIITGTLSEEEARSLLSVKSPRLVVPDNASGKVRFWITNGILSKYEFNVEGRVKLEGRQFPINRTTTVEITNLLNSVPNN